MQPRTPEDLRLALQAAEARIRAIIDVPFDPGLREETVAEITRFREEIVRDLLASNEFCLRKLWNLDG